MQLYGVVSVWK